LRPASVGSRKRTCPDKKSGLDLVIQAAFNKPFVFSKATDRLDPLIQAAENARSERGKGANPNAESSRRLCQ
jgi:hypothetical protein